MANEARVSSGLQIRKTSGSITLVDYLSRPSAFTADVTAVSGPVPGGITVTTNGTDVDLSGLTNPGLCRVANLSAVNSLRLGVWNPDQSEFYPVMKIKPGEFYVFRLDPDINEEFSGTGTGLTGQQNTLRLKAENAPVEALFEAFEE
jgi:hypothetical protein